MSQRIRRKIAAETGAMVLLVSPIAGCKRVKGKEHNENIKSHVMEWDKVIPHARLLDVVKNGGASAGFSFSFSF